MRAAVRWRPLRTRRLSRSCNVVPSTRTPTTIDGFAPCSNAPLHRLPSPGVPTTVRSALEVRWSLKAAFLPPRAGPPSMPSAMGSIWSAIRPIASWCMASARPMRPFNVRKSPRSKSWPNIEFTASTAATRGRPTPVGSPLHKWKSGGRIAPSAVVPPCWSPGAPCGLRHPSPIINANPSLALHWFSLMPQNN